MDFDLAICRSFHDEHAAASALLDDLQELLARGGRGLPDLDDAASHDTLARAARLIPAELHPHFEMEERIFPRLAEEGAADMAETLIAEHRAILPIGDRVAEAAGRAIAHGFTEAGWDLFRADAAEFVSRLEAHILKEEKALLPLLDEVLSPEDDLELAQQYAALG